MRNSHPEFPSYRELAKHAPELSKVLESARWIGKQRGDKQQTMKTFEIYLREIQGKHIELCNGKAWDCIHSTIASALRA